MNIIDMNDAQIEEWVNKFKLTPEEEAARKAASAAHEAFMRKEKVLGLRRDWNAPTRHARFDMAGKEHSAKWQEVFTACQDVKKGYTIALCGRHGTRKTQLGVEVMRDATERLIAARYESMELLMAKLRSSLGAKEGPTHYEEIQRLCGYPLLVLDEITKVQDTAFASETVFAVINARYNACKATILISNLTKTELCQVLGEAVTRRIAEDGGVYEL